MGILSDAQTFPLGTDSASASDVGRKYHNRASDAEGLSRRHRLHAYLQPHLVAVMSVNLTHAAKIKDHITARCEARLCYSWVHQSLT